MRVGVVGLGLIGGSLAKTISARTAHTVLGFDTDAAVLSAALRDGAAAETLTAEELSRCDLILVALRPRDILAWLRENAPRIGARPIVVDCGGVKADVCETGFRLAKEFGFTFIGGHPMAGTERSGYAASRDGLFDRASMILVPPDEPCGDAVETLRAFFLSLGFRGLTLTAAAEHDRIIAYTSQLAHIVSSAYIKSPSAQNYAGFSAGSFKDMTRVAFLNEPMWTELFLENRAPLLSELQFLIERLREYERALGAQDADALCRLLHEGKERKLLSEGRARE